MCYVPLVRQCVDSLYVHTWFKHSVTYKADMQSMLLIVLVYTQWYKAQEIRDERWDRCGCQGN